MAIETAPARPEQRTRTMQAVVKYDNVDGAVELREMPVPTITPDQVLIEVKACGVCGTDLHWWRGHSKLDDLPMILGHEFCGRLAQVGSDVPRWQVGDRVACETAAQVCGHCVYCHTGNYNVCRERKGYGYGIHGAMTRYVVARPEILHRLPDHLPYEEAAMIEPTCVSYNAVVEKSQVKPGDFVVVLGPGPIGLLAAQIARLYNPGYLMVVGLKADLPRLEVAKQLGVDEIIIVDEQDPVARVHQLGDGYGADLIIDAVGVSATVNQSLDMVRPNGQITKIGWGDGPLDFNVDRLISKAARLQGSFSHTYPTWERAVQLLASRKIDARPLSKVYPLADWRCAFSEMESLAIAKAVLIP